jgi:signal transduction histidine kinase
LGPAARTLAPTAWLRLPHRTARLRLTLLYSGLFLVLGTGLLALTFLLFRSSGPINVQAAPFALVFRRDAPPARNHALGVPGPGADISRLLPPPGLTASRQQPVTVSPQRLVRGVVTQARSRVVAQQSADIDRLLEFFWLGLALAALGSAGLGWLAAGRVLRPLRAITTTARTISAGNLHQRLALTGPDDEFKQLGNTLDDLLARLEASFEAQRRFVANASHELRTPLTLERTLLQVALADPDASADSLRATCNELLVSGKEHERLLEALLTLASSERGLDNREPLDLSTLTAPALLTSQPASERISLRVQTVLAPAPISGDPALLERLVANLIDNAVYHNVPGGQIKVETGTKAGRAFLSVANTGPVIATEEVDRLFEPFQQLNGDRTADSNGHNGLGLSIVRAIATAHDATLTARPQPEGGLSLTASFPEPGHRG